MYKGNDTCPGCNISGAQKPRQSKTSNCRDCDNAIKIGTSILALQEKEKYINMNVRWYSLRFFNDGNGGELLEKSFSDLFRTLSVDNMGEAYLDLTKGSATTASAKYSIRKDIYEKLLEVVGSLEKQQSDFKIEVNTYRKAIDDEFKEKKNDIYNDGLEKGRELLFSLNNGSITMDDFSKKITKY